MPFMTFPVGAREVTTQFLELIDASAPGLLEGLYLRGSLGFGEYFEGQSDVDFTAVLATRPDASQFDALAAAHAQVFEAHPHPHFDGFHLLRDELARPPDGCRDLPCMFAGTFDVASRLDVNPVSWHELARRGIVIRGPVLTGDDVWTDDAALRAFSHDNLTAYWAGVAGELAAHPTDASTPGAAAWCVLGVSRLHHLLATGALTSKSGAGHYALRAFEPQWRPIIAEALRAREQPAAPSAYDSDPAARARDTTAFTVMAIDAGLALGAVADGFGGA
jgi:Domain of unknown function (DUF4111)